MIRSLSIALVAFIIGAAATALLRAGIGAPPEPPAMHAAAVPAAAPAPAPAQRPIAAAAAAPATMPAATPAAAAATPAATAASASASAPINTICPICAMQVDSSLPTATYRGQTIGFGCRACPPIFPSDPERYGEAALKNVQAE